MKFVILVLALAPLLAAFGFAGLAGQTRRAGRVEVGCGVVLVLLIGLFVALAARLPDTDGVWRATWQNGMTRAVFLALALLLIFACANSAGRRRVLLGALLLLVFWLDFLTHMPAQNPGVQRSVYSPGWASAQLKLDPQPRLGQSRLMLAPAAQQALKTHVIASLEENYLLSRLGFLADCNLLEGVPQVHGFFSLVPAEANNVTVLPYVQTNCDFPALLDFMGVSQITAPGKIFEWARRPSAMPLVTAGQQPVFADDRTILNAFTQTNLDLRQVVFLPPEARGSITATRQSAARVLSAKFANQSIAIQAEASGPSLVVVSQSHYPAWRARVDGQPARIWRANYAFQAVEVPAGRHDIQMAYDDQKLRMGGLLSLLGLVACGGWGWLARRRERSFDPNPSSTSAASVPGRVAASGANTRLNR